MKNVVLILNFGELYIIYACNYLGISFLEKGGSIGISFSTVLKYRLHLKKHIETQTNFAYLLSSLAILPYFSRIVHITQSYANYFGKIWQDCQGGHKVWKSCLMIFLSFEKFSLNCVITGIAFI